MTTKLPSEKLRQAVSICNRFVPLRPSLPVLANIKFESQKTKLKLTATNLENSVSLELPSSGEVWETTIPAKLLVEFLNLVKSTEAILTESKETVEVVCGEARGSFNTIAASEFPTVPEEKQRTTEIAQKDLQQAVGDVVFAASGDEGKPVLNGILLRTKSNKTLLVATDSYRLAQHQLDQDYNLNDIIVPARALAEAVKIAGELGEEVVHLTTSAENNQLFIAGESFQIANRLIDGVYPAFEQIIPSSFVCEARVAKEEMVAAVKQTAVFARDTGNVVKLFLTKKEGLKVWASTKQVGEGSSSLKADVSGEDLEVAFNSHFLLEGLEAAAGRELKLRFSGSLKPALIVGENENAFNYIVMPVKPQN